jgi:hypothetical protein
MSKRHPKNTFCFVYPPINTCFRERRNWLKSVFCFCI